MGDNKISEAAVEAARDAYHEADVEPMRAAIEAALNHLQDEAVPVACVPDDAAVDELRRFANSNIGSAHGITRKQAREVLVKFANFYLHPQPAEQSEVSGDSGELGIQKAPDGRSLIQRYDDAGAKFREALMDDYFKDDERIRRREVLNAAHADLLAALAATGKQQVGEVQALTDQQIYDRFGFLEGLVNMTTYRLIADTAINIQQAALAPRQPVRIYGCCAQPEGELHTAECPNMRHLASRQPVVQEPVAWLCGNEMNGPVATTDPSIAAAFVSAGGYAKQLYAAPPAQGIDLGQFRSAVMGWRESLDQVVANTDIPGSDRRVAAGRVRECIRLLALLDGRDAGTGVGRG